MTAFSTSIQSPIYKCKKHGQQQYAVLFDHRRFCPKCVADHLEKAIGLVGFEK